MKHLAVLLCLSGLAAVCLGQNTTVANSPTPSTAPTTTVSTVASPAGSGATTTTTTGSSTTDAGSAGTAAATTVSCLNCTGDDASACGTGTGITTKVDCDECWVYREENAAGNVTITRGCAQVGDTCTNDNESENCNTVGGITTCRRCCTAADCNTHTLTGSSGAGDVTASVVVTMATALFAILALWQ